MDITPSQVAGATFKTARKGYDSGEVDTFLAKVAQALEESQQHATAMEARARAAVAKLQEVQSEYEAQVAAADPNAIRVGKEEAETISRTLLLAQRTADTAVAEARAEAARIRAEAKAEADATLDSTREMSSQLVEEARTEARRSTDAEREAAEREVQSLRDRRAALNADLDELDRFLDDQRERLRAAARQLEAICDRVPAGLAGVDRPALSPDGSTDDTVETARPEPDTAMARSAAGTDGAGTDGAGTDGAGTDDEGLDITPPDGTPFAGPTGPMEHAHLAEPADGERGS